MISQAPFFDNGLIDSKLCKETALSNPDLTTYFVQIFSIWGDVTAYQARHARQDAKTYARGFESFYVGMTERLRQWEDRLRPEMRLESSNVHSAVRNDSVDGPLAIQAMKFAIKIKLHRNFYHQKVGSNTASHNLGEARHHSEDLIRLLQATYESVVDSPPIKKSQPAQLDLSFSASTPFIAYAAMLATDVLTATGTLYNDDLKLLLISLSDVLQLLDGGIYLWPAAERQRQMIARRWNSLNQILEVGLPQKRLWRCRRALDPSSRTEKDICYPESDGHVSDRQNPHSTRAEILYVD